MMNNNSGKRLVCPYCYPFGVSFVVPKCPTCGKEAPKEIMLRESWIVP